MQSESDLITQFRKTTVRNAILGILFFSAWLFIARFSFYWTKQWFRQPTIQGILILFLFFLISLFCLWLLRRQQSFYIWLAIKVPTHTYWLWLFPFGGFLLLSFVITIILKSEFVGWKDQLDIFCFFTLFLFLISLTSYIFRAEVNARQAQLVTIFINRWKIFLLFGGLVLLKTIILTPYAHTLIAASDGYQYWEMGRQFFYGSLDIREFHHYPPLYPLAIAPSFLFGERYSLINISVINIFLSTAVMIPIYLIAHSFFTERISFLLTLLAALNPFQWVYPAFPSSENLYYLLFFCVMYFLLAQPTNNKQRSWWNLTTGVLIGLSWLTRYQTSPLIPIYLIAWWLKPVLSGDGLDIRLSREKIRQLLLLVTGIVIIFGIWVVAGATAGVPLKEITGFHIESGKISREHPISLLFFWSGIALAFFILMISPVLHVFMTVILHVKSITWDQKMIRWLVLAVLSSGVLWFTITRHAWLANYNYEEPTRLIGRYVIYAEMVLVMTAIELFARIRKVSYLKYLLACLFSLVLAYISYQVFNNHDWIFRKESISFLHLDGYTPLYLDWIFFFLVLVSGSVLGISLMKTNKEMQMVVILLSMILFQVESVPYFWSNIITVENQGRYISEIVDQIINSEHLNPNPNDSVTIHYPETVKYLDRQFRVKGVDITNYSFEVLQEYPVKKQKCEPFIQIDLANGQKYGIMSRTRGCEPTANQPVISEFEFNQRNYFLAPITR